MDEFEPDGTDESRYLVCSNLLACHTIWYDNMNSDAGYSLVRAIFHSPVQSQRASWVAVDITPAFTAYFDRNRGPVPGNRDARQAPDYGVSASLDEGVVTLTLTFRAGSAYCCYDWGCHLALSENKRWGWLRRELAARGVPAPDRLELRLSCVIEEGAVFFNLFCPDPDRRNWYAFEPVAANHYEVSAVEADSAPEAETRSTPFPDM